MRRTTRSSTGAVVAAGLVAAAHVSTAGRAQAQPDPFADYERWKAGEGPVPAVATVPDGPLLRTDPMIWGLGGRGQFSVGWASYGRPSGGNGSATNLFFRLTPEANLFVADRVQVGLSAGLYSRVAANTPGDNSDDTGFLGEINGYYYAPIGPRLAVVPGVGLGGYVGSGSRTLLRNVNGTTVEVEDSTTVGGFSGSVYVGLAYQLMDELQLRSGLAFHAMLGVQSVESRSNPLPSYMTHVGVPIELYYTF